jgi:D-beta-D-heptose 7-phosphate kinase/D-beta-D-heptose 1-phosphate adenosyltransferase
VLVTTPDFSTAHILVVGDVMLDRYWSGQALRISPEAPVPVVNIKNTEDRVGGAANVAINIARLGGKVTLLGVIGNDEEGVLLKNRLEQQGVACDFLSLSTMRTICKLRIMARHQQLIRADFEQTPLRFDQGVFLNLFKKHLASNTVVVFSDYGKGTLENIPELISAAKQPGVLILVDPKGADYSRYRNADVITPNFGELQAVVGVCDGEQDLQVKGLELIKQLDIHTLLCTRGEAGMTLIQESEVYSIPAQAKEVFDVTGAGDTVIAVMALTLAVNKTMLEAMYLSNLAAGIVVGKLGTSTVSRLELNRALHGERDASYGVVTEDELLNILEAAKAHGERIVMTNGCFDLLHVGHVTYLQQAKAIGDRLIVAVNSDASVKQLKGESRPINCLQDRMAVLAALSCVDWVVSFTEETPERLYCRLLPDVIVKGGDYHPEQVAGAECVIKAGGEVRILDFVEGQSTTTMINKAKERK